jgi:LytTr DNA-binding domain
MWKQFFHKKHLRLRWLFSFLLPLYIMAFSLVLEPLKGDIVRYDYPLIDIIVISLLFVSLVAFFCIGLPYLIPKYFHSEKFNLLRFFTWFFLILFLAATISYYFDRRYHEAGQTTEWAILYCKDYMIPLCIFLSSIILPFFFVYKFKEHKEIKLADYKEPLIPENDDLSINKALSVNSTPVSIDAPYACPLLKFHDSSGKNMLEIKLENLYYITSANNYIEVFYKKEDCQPLKETSNFVPTRILLRNTLKNVEEQNTHVTELYRCHKAFIVNKQKVLNMKGNAKGHTLILKDIALEIPVSRNKNAEIELRLPSNI